MFLSVSLKSRYVSPVFSSMWTASSLNNTEFKSFSLDLFSDTNPYRDFSLSSEVIDSSTSFSIGSSIIEGATNVFSLKSSVISSSSSKDYALKSSTSSDVFTDYSLFCVSMSQSTASFGVSSSFSKSKYAQAYIKSKNISKIFSSYALTGGASSADYIDIISFSMTSTFKLSKSNIVPGIIDLYTHNYVLLGITAFAPTVSGIISPEISITIDIPSVTAGVTMPMATVEVVLLHELSPIYKHIDFTSPPEMLTYADEIYLVGELFLGPGILNDFTSNIMSFNFSRLLQDAIFTEADVLSIPLIFRSYGLIDKSAAGIISTGYIPLNRILNDSTYYEIIAGIGFIKEDSFRNIVDSITYFSINNRRTKGITGDLYSNQIVKDYMDGSSSRPLYLTDSNLEGMFLLGSPLWVESLLDDHVFPGLNFRIGESTYRYFYPTEEPTHFTYAITTDLTVNTSMDSVFLSVVGGVLSMKYNYALDDSIYERMFITGEIIDELYRFEHSEESWFNYDLDSHLTSNIQMEIIMVPELVVTNEVYSLDNNFSLAMDWTPLSNFENMLLGFKMPIFMNFDDIMYNGRFTYSSREDINGYLSYQGHMDPDSSFYFDDIFLDICQLKGI